MGIVENVREIAELAKKYNDAELNQKILDLEGHILALITQIRSLEKASQESERTLTLIKKMQFKKPFYFQEDDPIPFCPHCWEREKNPIHLLGPVKVATGMRYGCPSCKEYFTVAGGRSGPTV
ncbi:MAG: hypothetical protein GTO13_02820 [Proteobacteria bacterium]|nr:hypothetical protein [Pseudomonadota bacterium]